MYIILLDFSWFWVWYVIYVDFESATDFLWATVASDHLARSFAGRVLQDAHLFLLSGDGSNLRISWGEYANVSAAGHEEFDVVFVCVR
jgi:hypothetical protein